MEHVLADGCRRGDYQDVEFTFGLSFEVPPDGNPNLIQQKFRLYLVKSSDLPTTVGRACTSPIPYFQGRWKNLATLHRIKTENATNVDKTIPTPVWGTLRVPLPVIAAAAPVPQERRVPLPEPDPPRAVIEEPRGALSLQQAAGAAHTRQTSPSPGVSVTEPSPRRAGLRRRGAADAGLPETGRSSSRKRPKAAR